MPTRLLRWIRSKLLAITARTPRSKVPLAAQSRELPVPYSAPAMTISGVFPGVLHRRVVMLIRSRVGRCTVTPPSTPGTSWLRSRMLAKVPRIITSWLPRRLP